MFQKECTNSIRYRNNKINSFNKNYLQEHVYKKYNSFIESKLNLRADQGIT